MSIEDNAITLETHEDILNQIIGETNRSTTLFRGVSNSAYKPSSTLLRAFEAKCKDENRALIPEELLAFEYEIICKFLAAANDNLSETVLPLSQCALDRLIIGRHYRLYTRLIDFTANPLVALFFACNKHENPNSDGAIYVLTTEENDPNYFSAYPPKYLPFCGSNSLSAENKVCRFHSGQCVIQGEQISVPSTLVVKPHNKLDKRIFSQDGYVIVPKDPSIPLEQALNSNQTLQKYVIPQRLKDQLRDYLENCHVKLEKLYGLPEVVEFLNKDTLSNFDKDLSALKLLSWNQRKAYIDALEIIADADQEYKPEEKEYVRDHAQQLGIWTKTLFTEETRVSPNASENDKMKELSKFQKLPMFVKKCVIRNAIILGYKDNDYDDSEKVKIRLIAQMMGGYNEVELKLLEQEIKERYGMNDTDNSE